MEGRAYNNAVFGDVPVGQRVVKQLKLRNFSVDEQCLCLDSPDPTGVFEVVN